MKATESNSKHSGDRWFGITWRANKTKSGFKAKNRFRSVIAALAFVTLTAGHTLTAVSQTTPRQTIPAAPGGGVQVDLKAAGLTDAAPTNEIRQGSQPAGAADQALVDKLKTFLASATGRSDFTLGPMQQQSSNSISKLSGSGVLFGIQGAKIEAQFVDPTLANINTAGNILSIKASFPSDRSLGPPALRPEAVASDLATLFLPAPIRDRMVLDVYQVEFNRDSQGIEDISVGYKLLEDWAILDEIDLKLSKAGVGFKLSKPNDPKKRAISGKLSGEMQISAATTLLLSSNLVTDKSKWELVSELANVGDVDLGRLLSRIAPKNALAGLDIPPGIFNVKVQKVALKVKPLEPSVALTGNCNLGNLEFVAKRVTQTISSARSFGAPRSPGVWKALVGVSLAPPLGLAAIHPSLNVLDRLKVTNTALVLSSIQDKVDTTLTVFKGLGLDVSIPQGLTFLGHIDLRNYNVDVARIVGVNNFTFRASIPANPANLVLEAIANFNDSVNIKETIYFRNLSLAMEPVTGKLTFLGLIELKLGATTLQFIARRDDLLLKGGMGIAPLATVTAQGAILGQWRDPFGFRGLTLRDMGAEIGIDFSTAPIPTPKNLMLTGAFDALSPTGTPYFSNARATIGFDFGNPAKNMIHAQFDTLNWQDIVKAFSGPQIFDRLPSEVRPFLNTSVRNVDVRLVPQAVTTITGQSYEQGFRIAGDAIVAGLDAHLNIRLEGYTSGFLAEGSVAPIVIGKGALAGRDVFSLTGNLPGNRSQLLLDLTTSNLLGRKNALLLVDGRVELLGAAQSGTKIALTQKGFELSVDGDVYGFLRGRMTASMPDFTNLESGAQVTFSGNAGEIQKKLMDKLNDATRKIVSLQEVSFSGKLNQLQSGADVKIVYRIANDNHTISIRVNPGSEEKFFRDAAEEIGKGAIAALDFAKDWAQGSRAQVEKIWKKSWSSVTDIAEDFSEKFKSAFDSSPDRKLLKVDGPMVRVVNKNGKALFAQNNNRDEAEIYLLNRRDRQEETWQFVPTKTEGYFYLVSTLTGRNLDVKEASRNDGIDLRLRGHRKSDNQHEQIKLIPAPGDPGYYYLQFRHSSKYIGLGPATDKEGDPERNAAFLLIAGHSGKALDIEGGSQAAGANLRQWDRNGTTAQQFVFEQLGDGWYAIRNVSSDQYLDVQAAVGRPGANVWQHPGNGSAAQRFRLKNAGGGFFNIISALGNDLCLDVAGASGASGANIQLWTQNGSDAQKFRLTPVPGYVTVVQQGATTDNAKFRIESAGMKSW